MLIHPMSLALAVISTQIHTGPGPISMRMTADAWGKVANDLHEVEIRCLAVAAELISQFWQSSAVPEMITVVAMSAGILRAGAAIAEQLVAYAQAIANEFETVKTKVARPEQVKNNRDQRENLARCNTMGQNTVLIAEYDAAYNQMSAQSRAAMAHYHTSVEQMHAQLPSWPDFGHNSNSFSFNSTGFDNVGWGNCGWGNVGVGNFGNHNWGVGNKGNYNFGVGITGDNRVGFGWLNLSTVDGSLHFGPLSVEPKFRQHAGPSARALDLEDYPMSDDLSLDDGPAISVGPVQCPLRPLPSFPSDDGEYDSFVHRSLPQNEALPPPYPGTRLLDVRSGLVNESPISPPPPYGQASSFSRDLESSALNDMVDEGLIREEPEILRFNGLAVSDSLSHDEASLLHAGPLDLDAYAMSDDLSLDDDGPSISAGPVKYGLPSLPSYDSFVHCLLPQNEASLLSYSGTPLFGVEPGLFNESPISPPPSYSEVPSFFHDLKNSALNDMVDEGLVREEPERLRFNR